MKSTIHWNQKVSFTAESGTGHKVVMDGPPDKGGEEGGPRPMELLLMGLGGCTGFDVVSILTKARQDLTGMDIAIDGERADGVPAVYTKIHVHFTLTGNDLSEKQVARAIELSAEKYCSASIMLGKTAEITHSYEIVAAS